MVSNLETAIVEKYLSEQHSKELAHYLQNKCKLIKNGEQLKSKTPTFEDLKLIDKIIAQLSINEIEVTIDDTLLELCKQCFLALRNFATTGVDIQNEILKNESLFLSIDKLFLRFINDEKSIECFLKILEFLGNMSVNNLKSQNFVWNRYSTNLFNCLKNNSNKVQIVACMILFNILKSNRNFLPSSLEFTENIINLCEQENEYAQFILELIITTNLTEIYENLLTENKLSILDFIHNSHVNIFENNLPENLIQLVVKEFKIKSDSILKTIDSYLNEIEPLEVVKLLDLIASLSSNENYLSLLQKDRSLLINCCFLLRSIHSVGKSSNNYFSAIEKISEFNFQSKTDNDLSKHPSFGFKASLIRIIGNLSWRNKNIQNEVRELECIEVILDCCNIDARNPFIIQWVILAIRNLCENNRENQSIIANMVQIGTIDSRLLEESGIVLHAENENEKIGIVPLK